MTTFEMLFKLATEPGDIFDMARDMAGPAEIALLLVKCAFAQTTGDAQTAPVAKHLELGERAARTRIENTAVKTPSTSE